jgi:hypothetical protein
LRVRNIIREPLVSATGEVNNDQVVSQFPEDIAAAVQAVAQDLADFPAIEGTTEPWPPMQIRSAR